MHPVQEAITGREDYDDVSAPVQVLGGRWRQIHHHGSIEDPRLLARYQTVVLGRPASLPVDVERSPLSSTQGTTE